MRRCKNLMTCALVAILVAAGASLAGEPKVVTNSVGMEFVVVSSGEFQRGSSDDDPAADADERPRRLVRITRPFALGRHEVSQEVYERVTGENPSWFAPGGGGRELVSAELARSLPVEMVSWADAVEFCRRLSELPEERTAGRVYRLPTEAEWEYAATAGGAEASPRSEAEAVDDARPPRTHTVGTSPPNAWGLFDMRGNVWEWCADWYDADYYAVAPMEDPQGPADGNGRVVRGGDYQSPSPMTRPQNRDFTRPSRRDWGNGLRVVLELR
ncbi:MAG: formylglycine-generating enzyme family protein [Pirellulales bacterium]